MTLSCENTEWPNEALRGARIRLVPFSERHITERYQAWLSDDAVNRYSRRLGQSPQSKEDIRSWLAGLGLDERVYAIETRELGHIGNIKYGPIKWSNRSADVSILIGEVPAWGKGYGAEAVYLVSKHLLLDRGLNRLSAGTVNPAFVRMVEKLGWRREGILREQALIGGQFHDSVILSMLRRDFEVRQEFEPAER